MPNEQAHLRQAEHNSKFLIEIGKCDTANKFNDWQVVVMFYIILHRVDSIIDKLIQCSPHGHEARMKYVARLIQFSSIREEYFNLYRFSIYARYECGKVAIDYEKVRSLYTYLLTSIDSIQQAI